MCSLLSAFATPRSPGRKCLSGGGSFAVVVKTTPAGARGSGAGGQAGARTRRTGSAPPHAPDQPRHRRAIRPADPYADGVFAVEAERPGVAIAVAGAGLEGDAAGNAVFRRRRADQYVAHVPRRDRLHESCPRLVRLAGRRSARPAAARAQPRDAGVQHDQIGQLDADPAESDRKPRRLAFRQHQRGARLGEPRGQAARADLIEHRERRQVERHLQRAAHRHRALKGEIEILRRVGAVAAGRSSISVSGWMKPSSKPSP